MGSLIFEFVVTIIDKTKEGEKKKKTFFTSTLTMKRKTKRKLIALVRPHLLFLEKHEKKLKITNF